MDIYEVRRRNFAQLVKEHWGGQRSVAAKDLGFAEPNLVTRYMSAGASAKNIGAAQARKIEKAAGQPSGWLDHLHTDGGPIEPIKASNVSERLNALPDALRQYILMEIALCEEVKNVVPADFMKAPTWKTRKAFQDFLHQLYEQRRRSVA
jgi:hypothetical protein